MKTLRLPMIPLIKYRDDPALYILLMILRIRFAFRFKPLPQCTHGQKEIKEWWQFDYLFCRLQTWRYNPKFLGCRLWIYTIAGGRCVDVYLKLTDEELKFL